MASWCASSLRHGARPLSKETTEYERRNEISHDGPRPGKQSRRRQSAGLPRLDHPPSYLGRVGEFPGAAGIGGTGRLLRPPGHADDILTRRYGLRH